MVMFVEDEMLRRALAELSKWCAEWTVMVIVDDWRIMHMMKKGLKRSEQTIVMHEAAVQNVAEYKHLGCIINEHVENKVMVDLREKAGARSLCVW